MELPPDQNKFKKFWTCNTVSKKIVQNYKTLEYIYIYLKCIRVATRSRR